MKQEGNARPASKTSKIILYTLLGVSAVLLVALSAWAFGEIFDTFGSPSVSGTQDSAGLNTGDDIGGTSSEEVIALVEKYIGLLNAGKNITLASGGKTAVVNAAEAGAPADDGELKEFLGKNGLDSGLVDKYREILRAQGQPGYTLNREYITLKIEELNALIGGGSASGFVIEGDKLIITRGSTVDRLNTEKTLRQIEEAMNSNSYGILNLETERLPAPPDWKALEEAFAAEPKNAVFKLNEEGLTELIPHVPGYTGDLAAIKNDYETGTWPKKEFTLGLTLPELTTENIRTVLFPDILSAVTTKYNVREKSRTNNVELAAKSMDGYVVLPGDSFSFNKVVGRRTKERGYEDATIYINGGQEPGLGGGICQVSSTLYKATMYANLKQSKRASHAFTVSYVELGMDATVYWGYLDYSFINDTGHPVMVSTKCADGSLDVTIRGTKPEKEVKVEFRHVRVSTTEQKIVETLDESLKPGQRVVESTGRPGYSIVTYRTLTVDGVRQAEEKLYTSVYKPYNGSAKVGPASPVTTPAATTPAATTPPPTTPPATTTKATTPPPTTPPTTTTEAPEEPDPEP